MKNVPLPVGWDESPKGCWAPHPQTRGICQRPPDGHTVHQRMHPNGTELEQWRARPDVMLIARKIVGDHVIKLAGAPSMSAYNHFKGDDLVKVIAEAIDQVIPADGPDDEVAPEPCVVTVGNIFDGVTLHGPFPTYEAANTWAEQEQIDDDWVVASVVPPKR